MLFKRVEISKNENVKGAMNAGTGFLCGFIDRVFGQSYDAHWRDQRLSMLEAMMPSFNACLTFLGSVITELGEARAQCNEMADLLTGERVAIKHGRPMSKWVMAKANQLKEGAEQLAKKLHEIRTAELRLYDRIFGRG